MAFPIIPILIAAAAVGGLVLVARESIIKAEVKRARDELFEIGPGCSYIKFKGAGTATTDSVNEAMATARRYYFTPKIAEARKGFPYEAYLGVDGKPDPQISAKLIMVYVLEDLFPECDWSTTPADKLSSQFAVYLLLGNWIRLESMRGIPCDPLGPMPAGMICIDDPKRGFVLERADL